MCDASDPDLTDFPDIATWEPALTSGTTTDSGTVTSDQGVVVTFSYTIDWPTQTATIDLSVASGGDWYLTQTNLWWRDSVPNNSLIPDNYAETFSAHTVITDWTTIRTSLVSLRAISANLVKCTVEPTPPTEDGGSGGIVGTGSSSAGLSWIAVGLVTVGGAITFAGRRRFS